MPLTELGRFKFLGCWSASPSLYVKDRSRIIVYDALVHDDMELIQNNIYDQLRDEEKNLK